MRLAEAEQERLAREGETAAETAARLEEEKAALLAEAFSAEQTVGAALGAAREECEKLGRTVEGLRDGESYTIYYIHYVLTSDIQCSEVCTC